MAFTVWKVALTHRELQDIDVPEGSELLTAYEQYNQACVWLKCDASKPRIKKRIAICGTGHAVPEDCRYIGTAHLHGGSLVLHVFEQISRD